MMNERIRELAEQAKGFVDLNHHIGGTNGCMVYTYDGLEKFADLIVRECINTLEFHGFDNAIPYVKWMAKNKLGQHFGVEE